MSRIPTFCSFCTVNHYENKKPKIKIGDRSRIFKYDIPFRKGGKPQFTRKVSEVVAISSRKPPSYTIMDGQDGIIPGKFYQTELMKGI